MPRLINPSDGSAIMLAIQSAYGTPVMTYDAPTLNAGKTKITTPGFLQRALPIRRLDVDGDAEITESDMLTASGATPPDQIGQVWARGVFDVRLLVEDFIYMLYGILNPTDLPTNTPVAELSLQSDTSLPDTGVVFAADDGIANFTQRLRTGGDQLGVFPAQLKITKTGGSGAVKGTVRGYRQIGRPTNDRYYQEEVVSFAASDTEKTTEKFWTKIDSVQFPTGSTRPDSLALDFVAGANISTMTFGTSNVIFPGWTGILSRGRSPARVQDLVPRTMTITANAQGMNAVFDCLGVQFREYALAEDDSEKYASDLDALLDSNFPDAQTSSYPGWGGAFQFGADIVKYEQLEFIVDQRLDFTQGVDGSRYRRGLERQGQRRVTISPRTQALAPENAEDMTQRWERSFLNEERLPIKLVCYAFDSQGRGARLQIDSPSSQLNAYPRFAIEGQGAANRPLSFLAQKSGETPEITVTIVSETGFALDKAAA